MSPGLPRVTAAQVIGALEHIGFRLTRQSGSHKVFRNGEGKRVTVPYHRIRILHPKLLATILRDAGLTTDEFTELLR